MAKYTGPKGKLVRRFGMNIFENSKLDRLLERKSHPPGQHGEKQQRRKKSDYGLQLVEKQKLKHSYGLLERQFRGTFNRAARKPGVTGENLLQLLETRLDNAAFRAGFGITRMQARQLVNHGHLLVNGRRVDIPSYQLKPGDVIGVRAREGSRTLVRKNIENSLRFQRPGWIDTDMAALTANITHLPQGEEIQTPINAQLIVELYSK